MHFQFLIEDRSGEVLIRHVMEKFRIAGNSFTFDVKSFKGIGGFKNSVKVKDIKTNKLLNDLPIFLKGFDKYYYEYDACIIVVLDNDERDTEEFRKELQLQAGLAWFLLIMYSALR